LAEILDMWTWKQINRKWHVGSEKYMTSQFYSHLNYVTENINFPTHQLRLVRSVFFSNLFESDNDQFLFGNLDNLQRQTLSLDSPSPVTKLYLIKTLSSWLKTMVCLLFIQQPWQRFDDVNSTELVSKKVTKYHIYYCRSFIANSLCSCIIEKCCT